jgi:SAM-dependent methyltransferase
MIARAERKARKIGVEVVFQNSQAQSLPFPDAQFDAVFSTVMLHHLPRKVREQAAAEMRRVLKPGGRVLVVDFGSNTAKKKSLLDHIHRRHGYVALSDILALLGEAGLKIVESGPVGVRDLNFVLAAAPGCVWSPLIGENRAGTQKEQAHRTTRPWAIWVALALLIFVHIAFVRFTLSPVAPAVAVLGIILLAAKHFGLVAYVLARFRRAARDRK